MLEFRRKSLHVEKNYLENLSPRRRGSLPPTVEEEEKMDSPRRGSFVRSWFRHIKDTADLCKNRDGRRRHPDHPLPAIPVTSPSETENGEVTSAPEKNRESEESTEAPSSSSGRTESKEEEPETSTATTTPPQLTTNTTPTTTESDQDSIAKKTGDDNKSCEPGENPPSSSRQQRMQRVEILRIAEASPLIDPSEVVVTQSTVLFAQPVCAPIEQLRRKDRLIRETLEEKQRIVADILNVPHEQYEHIAEMAGEPETDKEAKDLVLAAMLQVKRLDLLLNSNFDASEEEVLGVETSSTSTQSSSTQRSRLPIQTGSSLISISAALNIQLTQLLNIMKHRDEERDHLRHKLEKCEEQVHVLEDFKRLQLEESQSTTSSFISTSTQTQQTQQETGDECNTTAEVESSTATTTNDEITTTTQQEGQQEPVPNPAGGINPMESSLILQEEEKPKSESLA